MGTNASPTPQMQQAISSGKDPSGNLLQPTVGAGNAPHTNPYGFDMGPAQGQFNSGAGTASNLMQAMGQGFSNTGGFYQLPGPQMMPGFQQPQQQNGGSSNGSSNTSVSGGSSPSGGSNSGNNNSGGSSSSSGLGNLPEFGGGSVLSGNNSEGSTGFGGNLGGGETMNGTPLLGGGNGYPGAATNNNSVNSGSYQPATGAASQFFDGNSNIYNPFQADQNLSSSVASFGSQSLPGAAAFQQQLFAPGFSPMEQSYLSNVGQQQQLLLNNQMAQLGGQYSNTPFHSSYMNQANQLGQTASQNLDNTAMQLGLNRENLAAGAAGRILGSPLQATQQGAQDSSTMLSLINQLQTAPFSSALSYLSNTPYMSPTVTPGTQSGGGSKKG